MIFTDGSSKTNSYMLKVPPQSEMFVEFMKQHNFFEVESQMYNDVVPEMEQMYKNAGLEVRFGAKSYKLPTDKNYILLEDLRPFGFKNANRLEGLDMQHSKEFLNRLAQWHAASATRVANKGLYPEILSQGFFREAGKELMTQMFAANIPIIQKALQMYKGHEEYEKPLMELLPHVIEQTFVASGYDENEFNVLNHGDAWCNNAMYKYNEKGEIETTYLVDYQLPRYGSPAQDLFYFLLSSTKLEIKINQFDCMVKYYHDQLVGYLKLLKYPRKIPTLRDIHASLYKYSIWAFHTIYSVMGAVLLDPTEKANIESFMHDESFKLQMYANDRYRSHMEAILPWLYNRGAISC